jgi:lysophospholipase L1-like esterase
MPHSFPTEIRRVVVLGDSITYAGGYVTRLDAALEVAGVAVEVLNLGLPSETCSGLSEPGHAGGKFPRPTVHERLARVLSATQPDLLIAAYGMNCGMYYPYSEERAALYFEGRRRIHEAATRIKARVLHLTPPPFDAVPIKAQCLPAGLPEYQKPYVGYDDVLAKYSDWLLAQRQAAQWDVCDIRTPVFQRLLEARASDPHFCLAKDGVHLGAEGEWLIARAVIQHWNLPGSAAGSDEEFTTLVTGEVLDRAKKRQSILKDAWLSTCHHLRPGMNPGMPLHKAYAAVKPYLSKPLAAAQAP